MTDLSILIPSRNEMFLARTIKDILEHIEGNTDVITILDGQWAEPEIPIHPKVTVVYHKESIGQRAACNEAAKLSDAKYLMKVDAHCSFDQGFDVKLMADMNDNWTVVPTMRNLWAFDWKCPKCGMRTYQGVTPIKCANEKCDSTTFDRKMIWKAKESPRSNSYCFDSEPHFQYFKDFEKRPEYKEQLETTGLTETMSLQGSCFMLTKEKWFDLNICDEEFGSWGSQGIEVAVKTWLSGGRVIVNHKTYYAHMFRTKGGDFGFPYNLSGKQVEYAKKRAHDIFIENKWDKQIYPLSWLIKKFWPIPGWNEIPED